jgi:hypothetical protein
LRLALFRLAALAGILVATLYPYPGAPDSGTIEWCVLCGEFGLADAINNVWLFLPLGVALGFSRVSAWRRWLTAPAVALLVETTQLWIIPGRHATPSDVLFNSAGAALGVVLARGWRWWLLPTERRSHRLGVAAVLNLAVVLAASGWLARPSLPRTRYYGQWTANLGMYDWYRGRVLAARIGDQRAPSWRLEDSEQAREDLLAGEPVDVTFIAGPPTGRIAPIFSVFDHRRLELFLVGVQREDLVLKLRNRAVAARLTTLDLRWPDAMRGVRAGDTLRLAVRSGVRGHCLRLGERERCGLRFPAAAGWGWLGFVAEWSGPWRAALGAVWLALLALPVGWWMRGRWGVATAGAALLVLATIPGAVGLRPASALEWFAFVAALGVAHALRRGSSPLSARLSPLSACASSSRP